MPTAYFMDNSPLNPGADHHLDPPQFLSMEEVKSLSGVEYWQVDVDNIADDKNYWKLRSDRGYNYEDLVEISPKAMPDFDDKLKMFYSEHLHADEEIRLFFGGQGYFDVRDKNDKWIRILAKRGELLVLPAGIYHRFTLDNTNYAKVQRLFRGEPVWKAINRPADDHPARAHYVKEICSS